MKVEAELLQHPEGPFFLQHPCSSLQPSFKPDQDHVLLQNYKFMCENKLHHICYSQEKILQRFSLPVKAEKASESINTPKILDWNKKAFQTIFLS